MSNFTVDPLGWDSPDLAERLEERTEPSGGIDMDYALEVVLQGIADGRLRLSRFTTVRLKRKLAYRWRKRKKPSRAMHYMTRRKVARERYHGRERRKRLFDQSLHRASRHGGFTRARIEARSRKAEWKLTEDQWNELWDSVPSLGGMDAYSLRGVGMHLHRIEWAKPFELSNLAVYWKGKLWWTANSRAPKTLLALRAAERSKSLSTT